MGTELIIDDALLYPQSIRTLLSFKYIRSNGFHIETETENEIEYLLMIGAIRCRKQIVKKLPSFSSGLYYTYIRHSHHNVEISLKFKDSYSFKLWHGQLGHPGPHMMCRVLTNSIGHNMPGSRIPFANKFICEACAKGKLIVRPSRTKVGIESPIFLEHIHGDICGPIHPASRPFRYFIVLIDGSI